MQASGSVGGGFSSRRAGAESARGIGPASLLGSVPREREGALRFGFSVCGSAPGLWGQRSEDLAGFCRLYWVQPLGAERHARCRRRWGRRPRVQPGGRAGERAEKGFIAGRSPAGAAGELGCFRAGFNQPSAGRSAAGGGPAAARWEIQLRWGSDPEAAGGAAEPSLGLLRPLGSAPRRWGRARRRLRHVGRPEGQRRGGGSGRRRFSGEPRLRSTRGSAPGGRARGQRFSASCRAALISSFRLWAAARIAAGQFREPPPA